MLSVSRPAIHDICFVLCDSRLACKEFVFWVRWMHSCDKIREPIHQHIMIYGYDNKVVNVKVIDC